MLRGGRTTICTIYLAPEREYMSYNAFCSQFKTTVPGREPGAFTEARLERLGAVCLRVLPYTVLSALYTGLETGSKYSCPVVIMQLRLFLEDSVISWSRSRSALFINHLRETKRRDISKGFCSHRQPGTKDALSNFSNSPKLTFN